jgi:hypothetical protein
MLRQSVAGNSTFRGIVFCNVGTPKTVISNFVTTQQIVRPHILPHIFPHMFTPNDVPVGQKTVGHKKTRGQQCINSFLAHKLSHNCWLWILFWALTGPYPTLRFGGACGLGVGAF